MADEPTGFIPYDPEETEEEKKKKKEGSFGTGQGSAGANGSPVGGFAEHDDPDDPEHEPSANPYSNEQKDCPPGSAWSNAKGQCVKPQSVEDYEDSDYVKAQTKVHQEEQRIGHIQERYDNALEGIGTWDTEIERLINAANAEPGRARAMASQALAASYGQSGLGSAGVGGGGALTASTAAAQYDLQSQAMVHQLNQMVHEGRLSREDAIDYAAELGANLQSEKIDQMGMDEFNAEENERLSAAWSRIVDNNKHTHFGDGEMWGDDEEAIFRAMKQELQGVHDPKVRAEWMKRACGVLSSGQQGTAECDRLGYKIGLEDV